MVADKVQCKAVGSAFLNFIYAVKEGGWTDEAMTTFTAAIGAADDLKEDTDAAVPYVIAGFTEAYGDKKAGP
jgi:hypothetical protein